jgi:Flp pilus assembly protein TadG
VYLSTIRHRLSDEGGQAAIEFALVLPLLLLVLFVIVEFGRAWNAANDLNQVAADGARFAAVNRYPGDAVLLGSEPNAVKNNATILVTYSPNPCVVGGTVTVRTHADISLAKIVGLTAPLSLDGTAQMRVERCPS